MEEISLREVIETILKGKWLIAIVTAVCVLVTGVVSFFVLDSTYEAKTMLMVSQVAAGGSKITEDDRIGEVISELSRFPGLTADTYKEQVKAPEVLQYVKDEAGLDEISLEQLGRKISVESIENTNILTVSVTDRDPEKAARIANIISDKFTKFVSDTNRKQAQEAAEFIRTEMEREKVILDETHEKLKDLLAQQRGPEELRMELNARLSQLTSFKTEKNNTVIEFNIDKGNLQRTKELLKNTPMYIEVETVLANSPLLLDILKDQTGKSTAELAGLKLTEQQVNTVYTSLVGKVNNLEVNVAEREARILNLQEAIADLQVNIEKTQAELAEKQQLHDQLQHEYDLIKQTYDAYRQNYKEAMIKQSAEYGKASIVVVSEAVPPERPVAPNKKLNIAIALVLGIMISVFVVFIREYWITSGIEMQSAKDEVTA